MFFFGSCQFEEGNYAKTDGPASALQEQDEDIIF